MVDSAPIAVFNLVYLRGPNIRSLLIVRQRIFVIQIIALNLVETISIVFFVFMNLGTLIEPASFIVRCFFLVVFLLAHINQ